MNESLESSVRSGFIQGCALMKEAPPKKTVLSEKISKIIKHRPESPVGYEFTAGKRWALDQIRRREIAARRAVLEEKARVEAERKARHDASMIDELKMVIAAIEGQCPRYAIALRLAYLEKIPAAKWTHIWPRTSVNTLHQLKCRARNAAAEIASDELREWIGRN